MFIALLFIILFAAVLCAWFGKRNLAISLFTIDFLVTTAFAFNLMAGTVLEIVL